LRVTVGSCVIDSNTAGEIYKAHVRIRPLDFRFALMTPLTLGVTLTSADLKRRAPFLGRS